MLVDQAGRKRGLGHVAAGRGNRAVHVLQEQVDIGLGPRLWTLCRQLSSSAWSSAM